MRLCIIEHFEPFSQYASNESSAPTSEWLFLNKPCLIDCVPPRHSPSGGCCVTASLKLQISICHSGSSAATGLMGVLVKATSLQNKAIKMLRKLDVLLWGSHARHLISVLTKPPENGICWNFCAWTRIMWNVPPRKWQPIWPGFSQGAELKMPPCVVLGQLYVAPPPLSIHGANRQTLAPRAPNLLCYQCCSLKPCSPSSSQAVCLRQHQHLHSIHPLSDTLHRRIAFEFSLGEQWVCGVA